MHRLGMDDFKSVALELRSVYLVFRAMDPRAYKSTFPRRESRFTGKPARHADSLATVDLDSGPCTRIPGFIARASF